MSKDERWCLACQKAGHQTTECRSTTSLNSPQARELFRLCIAFHNLRDLLDAQAAHQAAAAALRAKPMPASMQMSFSGDGLCMSSDGRYDEYNKTVYRMREAEAVARATVAGVAPHVIERSKSEVGERVMQELEAVPVARCDSCNRAAFEAREIGQMCAMRQPAGGRCVGTFRSI